MSSLAPSNQAAGTFAVLNSWDDDRLQPPFRGEYFQQSLSFGTVRTDRLWPRSRLLGTAPVWDGAALVWDWSEMVRPKGVHARLMIAGFARDQTGAVLGGVTLNAYHAADNVVEDTFVTQADGAYQLYVTTTDNYYVVAFASGLSGVSDTNLTGV